MCEIMFFWYIIFTRCFEIGYEWHLNFYSFLHCYVWPWFYFYSMENHFPMFINGAGLLEQTATLWTELNTSLCFWLLIENHVKKTSKMSATSYLTKRYMWLSGDYSSHPVLSYLVFNSRDSDWHMSVIHNYGYLEALHLVMHLLIIP